jgi:hypothetical protein
LRSRGGRSLSVEMLLGTLGKDSPSDDLLLLKVGCDLDLRPILGLLVAFGVVNRIGKEGSVSDDMPLGGDKLLLLDE